MDFSVRAKPCSRMTPSLAWLNVALTNRSPRRAAAKRMRAWLSQGQQVGGGWDVFDNLGRLRADAEVAEIREDRRQFVAVGDIDEGAHHGGGVALGVPR